MSGASFSLVKRKRCTATGRDYTVYGPRYMADASGTLSCPECNKRVTLKISQRTGKLTQIPNHYELIIG